MKTIFDKATRDELIVRIHSLNENNVRQWGKMSIHQMLKHVVACEEMFLGKKKYKRALLGRIFGKIGLKKMLKDESPIQRNAPTSPHFKIQDADENLKADKNKWISLVEEYATYSPENFEHWFFGKMTKEQIGQFVYKHIDHHLRQFNG
jgi:hypothetical protein